MTTFAAFGGAINAEGAGKSLQHLFRPGYSTGLAISQRGAGANMSVDVAAGGALHVTSAGVPYYAWSDATANVAVTTSNPTNPRKDILVSYIDLSLISTGTTNNQGALKYLVVAGTPAASPVDPSGATIQAAVGAGNPYNQLARIDVAASASTIVNANITDLRAPMALAMPYLYGGGSNTKGHLVPNIADDTFALLAAVQTFTNKIISGITNTVRAGGANSSLKDANGVQMDLTAQSAQLVFDHINSGCVWSGNAYGSTLVASCTSGVAWIGGKSLTVAAVTNRTFTASKDVYCDLKDNGDGTAVWVYYDNTTNAASPSFATTGGTMRGAIVVTGASSIANAAAINQGQEDRVLPIVSSVPYAVTDGLGNLICPRDPNRKVLGYRQITTSFPTTSITPVQVTGLSAVVNIPAGRRVKVKVYSQTIGSSANPKTAYLSIWDGTVGSGTQVESGSFLQAAATYPFSPSGMVESPPFVVPSGGLKTFNVGLTSDGSGGVTTTMAASTNGPAYLSVELA